MNHKKDNFPVKRWTKHVTIKSGPMADATIMLFKYVDTKYSKYNSC